MKARRTVAMLLMLCLLISVSFAQAAVVYPTYVATSMITVTLSISGSGVAHCEGFLDASVPGSVPKLTLTLKRSYNGTTWYSQRTWYATGTYLMGAAIDQYASVESGYLYRLYATGRVYDANGVLLETVYKNSSIREY